MDKNKEQKVSEITIRWIDGDFLQITQSEIDKMIKAGEALELMQDAKEIANKLVRLSS